MAAKRSGTTPFRPTTPARHLSKQKPSKGSATGVATSKENASAFIVQRNAKTGLFTSAESARVIKRNTDKYSAVLERLAKK